MKGIKKRLPSPAMIVALLALTVSLGGVTYAAKKLKKNSVGTKQLKSQAVTDAKLADNSVTTPKIAGSAVTGVKIGASAVDTSKLANGAVDNAKLGNDSVNSAKVVDGSLTRADHQNGVLVSAYGRINNAAGDPTIGAGSVNINDLDVVGVDGAGDLLVTFSNLPTAAGNCAINVQPLQDPAPVNPGTPMLRNTAMVGTGGGSLSATTVEVQTLNNVNAVADVPFFITVSCPPA